MYCTISAGLSLRARLLPGSSISYDHDDWSMHSFRADPELLTRHSLHGYISRGRSYDNRCSRENKYRVSSNGRLCC